MHFKYVVKFWMIIYKKIYFADNVLRAIKPLTFLSEYLSFSTSEDPENKLFCYIKFFTNSSLTLFYITSLCIFINVFPTKLPYIENAIDQVGICLQISFGFLYIIAMHINETIQRGSLNKWLYKCYYLDHNLNIIFVNISYRKIRQLVLALVTVCGLYILVMGSTHMISKSHNKYIIVLSFLFAYPIITMYLFIYNYISCLCIIDQRTTLLNDYVIKSLLKRDSKTSTKFVLNMFLTSIIALLDMKEELMQIFITKDTVTCLASFTMSVFNIFYIAEKFCVSKTDKSNKIPISAAIITLLFTGSTFLILLSYSVKCTKKVSVFYTIYI